MEQNKNLNHQINACPYLGIVDDPESRFLFANNYHLCYRVDPAESINFFHQEETCLTSEHEQCPVFIKAWEGKLPGNIAGSNKRGIKTPSNFKKWIAGIVILMIVGVIYFFSNIPTEIEADGTPTDFVGFINPQTSTSQVSGIHCDITSAICFT